jgi:hypothetical protein
LAIRLLRDALCLVPVLPGWDSVNSAEGTGEVGGAAEAPAGGDGVDRRGAQGWVGEVAAGAFQALVAYPGCNRLFFVLEEAVQVAGGDVVRGGDGAWGQLRIMQVAPDERTDAQDKGLTVSFRREQFLGL